jgi:hypothetical protein
MPDDLYPGQVNPVLFHDAYELHRAAAQTYRLANKPLPPGMTPEVHAQRRAILTIDAQLLVLERDRLLDAFCVSWLKYRSIPIPEKDNGPSSTVGVQGPQGSDGRLRGQGGVNEGGQAPLHNPSTQASTQPGGVSVP